MTWMPTDHDHFETLVEVADLDPLALLIDMRLRLWSSKQGTAGHITPAAVRRLAGTVGLTTEQATAATDVLENTGTWTVTPTGWTITGFAAAAAAAERREAAKAKSAERVAKHRGRTITPDQGILAGTTPTDQPDEPAGIDVTPCNALHRGDVTLQRREEKRRNNPLTPKGDDTPNVPPRHHDELTAVIAETLHPNQLATPSALRRIHRAANELAGVNATAQQIRDCAATWRQRHPDIPLTAPVLTRHWPDLLTSPPDAPGPIPISQAHETRARTIARNLHGTIDRDDLAGLVPPDTLHAALAEWDRLEAA